MGGFPSDEHDDMTVPMDTDELLDEADVDVDLGSDDDGVDDDLDGT